jgi:hypothetical protein
VSATVVKVPVKARVRLPDGREFTLLSETEADTDPYPGDAPYSGTQFYWTEGNQSCDCNRALDINRQHGLSLPVECGDTMTLLSLEIDGVERLT